MTFGKPKTPARSGFVGLNLESLEGREVPAIITQNDNYVVEAGRVFTVDGFKADSAGNIGVLNNDFSTTNSQAALVSTVDVGAKLIPTDPNDNAPALPQNTFNLRLNGGFTLVAPSNLDLDRFSKIQVIYKVVDLQDDLEPPVNGVITFTLIPSRSNQKIYATGAGPGAEPRVRAYDAITGQERFSFLAYEPSFTGGVRVSTGDVNGDGVDDIITSPSEGGSARIRMFDGKTQVPIGNFFAFEDTFRGGAEIAVGDIDLDDRDSTLTIFDPAQNELVVAAGTNGGPRVTIYTLTLDANNFVVPTVKYDFFAFENSLRNGVRVAVGNVGGTAGTDRRDFVVVGAGTGGGPAVKIFDGFALRRNTKLTTEPPPEASFFAFDQSIRSGVTVAVGKFRNDGTSDIVVGSGNGDVVRVFNGRTRALQREFIITPSDGSITPGGVGTGSGVGGTTGSSGVGNFGGSGSGLVNVASGGVGNGGVRVAVTTRNSDDLSDIIFAPPSGQLPRVRIFDGNTFGELDNFLAFPSNFLGGVFVGGNSL